MYDPLELGVALAKMGQNLEKLMRNRLAKASDNCFEACWRMRKASWLVDIQDFELLKNGGDHGRHDQNSQTSGIALPMAGAKV